MALDPNREEKLRQKYMPPDPTTQSSMQYAKSLLAQKDERDNEAFERSKKNAKKDKRIKRTMMAFDFGANVWKSRNESNARRLEDQMAFDVAKAEADWDFAGQYANAWINRENRWDDLGGIQLGSIQDAKDHYRKLYGGDEQIGGWSTDRRDKNGIKHGDPGYDSESGMTKEERIEAQIMQFAQDLQNKHEEQRVVVEKRLGTSKEEVIRAVSNPYKTEINRRRGDNLISAAARKMGLIDKGRYESVDDFIDTQHEIDGAAEQTSAMSQEVRDAMVARAKANLPMDMQDMLIQQPVTDHGLKYDEVSGRWGVMRERGGKTEWVEFDTKSIGDVTMENFKEMQTNIAKMKLLADPDDETYVDMPYEELPDRMKAQIDNYERLLMGASYEDWRKTRVEIEAADQQINMFLADMQLKGFQITTEQMKQSVLKTTEATEFIKQIGGLRSQLGAVVVQLTPKYVPAPARLALQESIRKEAAARLRNVGGVSEKVFPDQKSWDRAMTLYNEEKYNEMDTDQYRYIHTYVSVDDPTGAARYVAEKHMANNLAGMTEQELESLMMFHDRLAALDL